MVTECIGWFANILFVIGCISIARKNATGFYVNTAGNICYVVIGTMKGMPSLIGISFFLICTNTYGIIRWSKQ